MWPPAVDKPSRHMQRCPSYPSLSDRCNTSHSKVGGAFISLSDFVLVPVFHLCVSSLQPPLYPGLFGMCTAGWSVSAVLLVGLSTFCKCPSWSLLCLYVHSARSSASCKEIPPLGFLFLVDSTPSPAFRSSPRPAELTPDRRTSS